MTTAPPREEVTVTQSTTNTEVNQPFEQYFQKGWPTLFPLPENKKYPPKPGFTGNIETVSEEVTRREMDSEMGNFNLGLRMDITGDYDVISIDVDHYDSKQGMTFLSELMVELGDLNLNEIPRSTRRGPKSPSAQYFFLVPKDLKWDSKACADVDIVQKNHRYSVVWPSRVDGEQYRWYIGEEVTEIPHVNDLPVLPGRWVEFLKKGPLSLKTAPAEDLSWSEADEWVPTVAPSWDGEPGPIFQSILKDEELFSSQRHDTMVSEQKHFLRLAVLEGQTGLKKALTDLEYQFIEAVSNRATRDKAAWEFESALYSEVNNLRGDIEHDKAVPFMVKYNPELLEGLTSLAGARKVREAHEAHEAQINRAIRWKSPAAAVAELVAVLCPELVTIRVAEGSDVILDMEKGSALQPGDMRRILDEKVMPEISRYRSQFEQDTDEVKAAAAAHSEAYGQFKAGNLHPLFENVANAIRDTGRVFDSGKLNSDPWLVGVDSEVIDLREVQRNPEGDLLSWMRPSTFEDAVTKTIPPVDIRGGLKSLEYREQSPVAGATITEQLIKIIHPDDETRRFVQKSLGYSIFGQNKMHKFFVWFGPGGSGKGSLAECMLETLGPDYASELTPEQFKRGSASRPDPDYAASLGTRVTFVNETEEGMQIDAAAIKRGTETRTARELYSNEVVKYDGNTITVMTNRPFVFNHDSGVARRLAVIPFDQSRKAVRDVQPGEMEPWRERDEEKVWFLLWLLEGFVLAMSEGLETEDYPPLVAKATQEFIEEADPSVRFFSLLERTGDPEDFLSSDDLCANYRNVTGERSLAISDKALSMKISRWFKDQGHASDKGKRGNTNGYRGWVIREP